MLTLVCILSLLALPRGAFLTGATPLIGSQGQQASSPAVSGSARISGREQGGGRGRRLPNLPSDAGEAATSGAGAQTRQEQQQQRWRRRQQQEEKQQQQQHDSSSARGAAGAPMKPEPAVMTDRLQVPVSERCVFILGTGRSGSTSLLDAVNQLPNYLIRGEQKSAFWHLFETWKRLGESANTAKEYAKYEQEVEAQHGEQAAAWLTYDTVKGVYDKYAVLDKMPWFNDLHRVRLADAARAFYSLTYGYHGPGFVSGFKEIRFVCGLAFNPPNCQYEAFVDFLYFMRMLCQDVKVLLNSRASYTAEGNAKLGGMLARYGVVNDTSSFENVLKITHEWFDRYAAAHPDVAMRVIMEDMLDIKVNASLARRMLTFLGEDPDTPIRFNRMPTWSTMSNDPAASLHVKDAEWVHGHHQQHHQSNRREAAGQQAA